MVRILSKYYFENIISCINKTIAAVRARYENGDFHEEDWEIIINEDTYHELKRKRNEIYFRAGEEIVQINGIDIRVVPNWALSSGTYFFSQKE